VINIGCRPSEAMHLGYCASDENIELALGNSILEMGVNLAIAIPEVRWLEYSYQNLGHLSRHPSSFVTAGSKLGSARPRAHPLRKKRAGPPAYRILKTRTGSKV